MGLGLPSGQSISRYLFLITVSASVVLARMLGGKSGRGGQSIWRSMSSSSSSGNVSYTPTAGDGEYQKTLMSMFRAVKKPSRHLSDKEKTNNELFKQRKTFYNELAKADGPFRNSKASIIHVAGSKGKGSVVEYIGAGLRKASQVGVFTSPHLHTARERIKMGTTLISRDDLTRIGKQSLDIMKDVPWAVFFDMFLATAVQYFDEQDPDYIILETGIGGRFDSTNFVDKPSVGIITSISLDHQGVLGDTLELISWQKAGIIKPGMSIFTPSTQSKVALEVITKQCQELGAKLHVVNVSLDTCLKLGITPKYDIEVQNLCISEAVLRHLRVQDLSGIKDFFWPCRMEKFDVNGVTMILDGSHNGDSVQLFLEGVRKNFPGRSIRVLFGGGLEKCLDDMMLQVHTHADSVVFLQSSHFKSASEKELYDAMNGAGYDVSMPLGCKPLDSVEGGTIPRRIKEALDMPAPAEGKEKPVVVVCGSLFAAADARTSLYNLHPHLFKGDDWVKEGDF